MPEEMINPFITDYKIAKEQVSQEEPNDAGVYRYGSHWKEVEGKIFRWDDTQWVLSTRKDLKFSKDSY